MLPDVAMTHYLYEPEQNPKRKHHWPHPEPILIRIDNEWIGKCPAGVTLEEAEALLNQGVSWSPENWPHQHPKRIYLLRQGIVYRATPTIPGVSYHAFPERAGGLPRSVERRLYAHRAGARTQAGLCS